MFRKFFLNQQPEIGNNREKQIRVPDPLHIWKSEHIFSSQRFRKKTFSFSIITINEMTIAHRKALEYYRNKS